MSAISRCAQQLVHVDEAGKCHIQEEAAAYLGQLEGKLSVIGIAGLYRTGKSFLLNRLLGSQSGFTVGSSVNPCTKGLWIWGEAVQLAPDHHCMLIDTEGLGSTKDSQLRHAGLIIVRFVIFVLHLQCHGSH